MLTIRFNRVLNELAGFLFFHHNEIITSVLFGDGFWEQVKIGVPNKIRVETDLIRKIRPYVGSVSIFQIGRRRAVFHKSLEQLSCAMRPLLSLQITGKGSAIRLSQ